MIGKKKNSISITPDDRLIEKIQPRGGISFRDERIITAGNGYETCIHVYALPHIVTDYWLADICNLDDTVVTVDIHTEDPYEVKRNLNRSIDEQYSRMRDAQTVEEAIEAESNYSEMMSLLRELSTMGEIVKSVHIRIFVYSRSKKDLDERVSEILKKLESDSYKVAIYLNETKNEWLSMWRDSDEQNGQPFSTYDIPLQSAALAGGDPFHFSSLDDENGDFLGTTSCNGNVIFDEFSKSTDRLYYNAVCVGEMGSGKSTLLKKRFLARAIRGDYVRTFDITGEFHDLTTALGGKVIRPDGTGGMLNPLEILDSGDTERVSFIMHISKVTTIYRFLYPTVTVENAQKFSSVLREFYESINLAPETASRPITGRKAAEYPTFSEFLAYLDTRINELTVGEYSEIEAEIAKRDLGILLDIKGVVDNVVKTYGTIFDGHTNMSNILDEQIVTFDLSQLKEMDAAVFDAQLFNMLSLCWDNCVRNGKVMKHLYESERIKWEDITRYLILIDEAHRWINAQKTQAVELVNIYMREARKYFGGIWIASQSIRDFVPEGTSDERFNKLKDIFELTQYKFIFRQNSAVVPLLDKIFGSVLTDSQKNEIPKQSMGTVLLNISADQSIRFMVYLSDREKKLFAGGA